MWLQARRLDASVGAGVRQLDIVHGREPHAMNLTRDEIGVLLESLEYSIQRVSEARGTPYAVRQENLQRLSAVQTKLRQMVHEGPD
jgi:hypothetical protein